MIEFFPPDVFEADRVTLSEIVRAIGTGPEQRFILGEATARYFVGQGANVVVFDRDGERGKAIETELGGRVVFVEGSVLDDDDTQAAVAAATDLGGLRGVVACAGGARASARTLGRDGTPHDRQLFTDTVDLNLVGKILARSVDSALYRANQFATHFGHCDQFVLIVWVARHDGQGLRSVRVIRAGSNRWSKL